PGELMGGQLDHGCLAHPEVGGSSHQGVLSSEAGRPEFLNLEATLELLARQRHSQPEAAELPDLLGQLELQLEAAVRCHSTGVLPAVDFLMGTVGQLGRLDWGALGERLEPRSLNSGSSRIEEQAGETLDSDCLSGL